MGNKRVIGIKRSVNSIIRKSGRESMLVSDNQLQVIYRDELKKYILLSLI